MRKIRNVFRSFTLPRMFIFAIVMLTLALGTNYAYQMHLQASAEEQALLEENKQSSLITNLGKEENVVNLDEDDSAYDLSSDEATPEDVVNNSYTIYLDFHFEQYKTYASNFWIPEMVFYDDNCAFEIVRYADVNYDLGEFALDPYSGTIYVNSDYQLSFSRDNVYRVSRNDADNCVDVEYKFEDGCFQYLLEGKEIAFDTLTFTISIYAEPHYSQITNSSAYTNEMSMHAELYGFNMDGTTGNDVTTLNWYIDTANYDIYFDGLYVEEVDGWINAVNGYVAPEWDLELGKYDNFSNQGIVDYLANKNLMLTFQVYVDYAMRIPLRNYESVTNNSDGSATVTVSMSRATVETTSASWRAYFGTFHNISLDFRLKATETSMESVNTSTYKIEFTLESVSIGTSPFADCGNFYTGNEYVEVTVNSTTQNLTTPTLTLAESEVTVPYGTRSVDIEVTDAQPDKYSTVAYSVDNDNILISEGASGKKNIKTISGLNFLAPGSKIWIAIYSPEFASYASTVKYFIINIESLSETVTIPTANTTTFTYNGSSQTYYPIGFDSTKMNITNNIRTDAGSQTVTVSLKDTSQYVWSDGTTTSKTFTFTINKKTATLTFSSNSLTLWNGELMSGSLTYSTNSTGTPSVSSRSNTNLKVSISTTSKLIYPSFSFNSIPDDTNVTVKITIPTTTNYTSVTASFTVNVQWYYVSTVQELAEYGQSDLQYAWFKNNITITEPVTICDTADKSLFLNGCTLNIDGTWLCYEAQLSYLNGNGGTINFINNGSIEYCYSGTNNCLMSVSDCVINNNNDTSEWYITSGGNPMLDLSDVTINTDVFEYDLRSSMHFNLYGETSLSKGIYVDYDTPFSTDGYTGEVVEIVKFGPDIVSGDALTDEYATLANLTTNVPGYTLYNVSGDSTAMGVVYVTVEITATLSFNPASGKKNVEYGTSSTTFTYSTNSNVNPTLSWDNNTAVVSRSGKTITVSNLSSISVGTKISITLSFKSNNKYTSVTDTFEVNIVKATPTLTITPNPLDIYFGESGTVSFTTNSDATTLTANAANLSASKNMTNKTITFTSYSYDVTYATTVTATVTLPATTKYNSVTKTFTINMKKYTISSLDEMTAFYNSDYKYGFFTNSIVIDDEYYDTPEIKNDTFKNIELEGYNLNINTYYSNFISWARISHGTISLGQDGVIWVESPTVMLYLDNVEIYNDSVDVWLRNYSSNSYVALDDCIVSTENFEYDIHSSMRVSIEGNTTLSKGIILDVQSEFNDFTTENYTGTSKFKIVGFEGTVVSGSIVATYSALEDFECDVEGYNLYNMYDPSDEDYLTCHTDIYVTVSLTTEITFTPSSGTKNVYYSTSSTTFTYATNSNATPSISDDNGSATVKSSSASLSGGKYTRTVTVSNLSSITSGTTIIVTITIPSNNKFKALTDTFEITIINAQITVSEVDYNDVYDGNAHSGSVTPTTKNSISATIYYCEGIALTSSNYNSKGTTTNPSFTDVTSTTVYYYITAANHDSKSGSFTVTITQATGYINLSATEGTSSYGTKTHTFNVTSSHGGNLKPAETTSTAATYSIEGNTITISNLSSLDASTTVKVKVTCEATTNYTSANETYTLTITQATGYITLSKTSDTVTYGTASNSISISTSHGNEFSVEETTNTPATQSISDKTVTIATLSAINAGTTITIKVTCAATANYSEASATFTLTITQADGFITLAKTSDTVTYGTVSNDVVISTNHGGDISSEETTNTSASPKVENDILTISNLGSINASTVITIKVTCAETTNYTEASVTYTITIEKATGYITLDKTSGNIEYGTESKIIFVASSHGEAISAQTNNNLITTSITGTEITLGSLETINAGTSISVTVYCEANANYTEASVVYTLLIVKRTIGIEWSNTNLIYNGYLQKPIATPTNLVNDDTVTVTVTGEQKNVGTHTATVIEVSNSNYKLPTTNLEVEFTINAKEVGINWTNLEFTYDGNSHIPTATATGVVGEDTVTITVATAQINAGNYTATATELNNSNYCLPSEVTKSFVIKAKGLTITAKTNTITYGQAPSDNGVTCTGFVTGEDLSVLTGTLAYDFTYEQYDDVGTYTITPKGLTSSNYSITFNSGNLNVVQKNITVSVTPNSNGHVYTGSVDYNKGFEWEVTTELENGDTKSVISVNSSNVAYYSNRSSTFNPNVNEYTITMSGLSFSSTNYKIANTAITYNEGTYSITPAEITVPENNDATKEYDGTALVKKIVGTSVNDQTITYVYKIDDVITTNPSRTVYGTTTVECTMTAANHDAKTITYEISITKKGIEITVKPADQTSVYTGNLAYDNAANYAITKVETLAPGEDSSVITLDGTNVTFKFDGTAGVKQNVAEHVISMVGLTATAQNYTITNILYETGTFTVTSATLGVNANGYTATYDGESHEISIEVTVVNNQDYRIYYSKTSIEDAAATKNETPYTFKNVADSTTVYYVVEADNHTTVKGSVVVTITPKGLTVTVKPVDQTSVYSNAVVYAKNFEYSAVDGLVGEDTRDVIKTSDPTLVVYKFDGNTTTPQAANEDGYVITLENLTLSADNYTITTTFAEGKLKITKKSLETSILSIPEITLVYNGNPHEPTVTVKIVLVDGNEAVTLTKGTDFTVNYTNNTNAGENTAGITVTGIGNYKDNNSMTFSIAKAEMGDNAAELETKTLTVLVYTSGEAALSTLADINLAANANSFGYWKFDELDLSKVIYQAGSNEYAYEYAMTFVSINDNYNNATGTLRVELKKNDVVFTYLEAVDVEYNREAINQPEYEVQYYNETFNGKPTFDYFKNNLKTTYVPEDAGTYTYKVVFAETEYYNAKTSDATNITIRQKNVADLEFTDLVEKTYTGYAITQEFDVKHGEDALDDTEHERIYANNVNANNESEEKATITIMGKGNYTGSYVLSFTINPKDINTTEIASIADQVYDETQKTPSLTIKDPNRENAVLVFDTDYDTNYTNNTNVGTANVEVTGDGNYTGTVNVTFEIIKGSLPTDRISDTEALNSTVDSLLSTLVDDLSAFNNTHGEWSFWNNNTDSAYDEETIVADKVGNGYVVFGIKFTPYNTNYNEIVGETIIINISLNASKVTFVTTDPKPVYDTTAVVLTNADISRTDANDNAYEEEFDGENATFKYYLNGVGVIEAKNAATYTVEVIVPANRKYAEARTTLEFTIDPREISEADVTFLDQFEGTNSYEYAAGEIKPSIQLSYGNDNNITTYEVVEYKNNINLTSVDKIPTIVVSASGNYKGTADITFDIIQKNIDTLEIGSISDQYYTGSAIEPTVSMSNNGTKLVVTYRNEDNSLQNPDADIVVTYTNNIDAGTATITVEGINNYTNTNTTTFIIVKQYIDKDKVAYISNISAYVGKTLATITLPSNEYGQWVFVILDTNPDATVGEANAMGNVFEVEFRDYENAYTPTKKEISIIVSRYTATITVESLNKTFDRLAINPEDKVTYDGDATPEFTYYHNGEELDEAPVNAGTYSVVISAEGTSMYEPASIEKTFTISKAVIGSENVVINELAAQEYANGAQLTPSVKITHTYGDNETYDLIVNTDYITMYNANNVIGEDTGAVHVFGLGNYTTEGNYETVLFDIVKEEPIYVNDPETGEPVEVIINIAEMNNVIYNGQAQTPNPEVTATINGITSTLVKDEDYTVSYSSNVNVGVVTVTFTFVNYDNATRSRTFTIEQFTLTEDHVSASEENGTVSVVVEANETTLTKDTDYTIESIDTTTRKVVVKGTGNFTGTVTITYDEAEPTMLTIIDANEHYEFATYGRKWEVLDTRDSYDENTTVYLRKVSHGQSITTFLTQFKNDSSRIVIKKLNGDVISDAKYDRTSIGTGWTVELYDESMSTLLDKVTVIVTGDINGDGRITASDRNIIINYYKMNQKSVTVVQKLALDADYNSRYIMADYNIFEGHFSNTALINQEYLIS